MDEVSENTATPVRRSRTMGGVVAGLWGGAAMWAFVLILNAARGAHLWPVVKLPGYLFTGQRAFAPGFDAGPVVVGAFGHFAVSVVWGLWFALLFYGFSKGATLVFGLLWGLVAWATMIYLLMPLVGLGAMANAIPTGLAIVQYLVFGLFLAIGFLPFQRRIEPPAYRRRVSV